MSRHHDAVRDTLSADDLTLYEALGRTRNPIQGAFATLSGEHRAFAIAGWIMGFALFAVAVLAVTRFSAAESVREMIGWAAVAVVALLALGFVKMWFFMEIQKEDVLRALKRVELQVAALHGR